MRYTVIVRIGPGQPTTIEAPRSSRREALSYAAGAGAGAVRDGYGSVQVLDCSAWPKPQCIAAWRAGKRVAP